MLLYLLILLSKIKKIQLNEILSLLLLPFVIGIVIKSIYSATCIIDSPDPSKQR